MNAPRSFPRRFDEGALDTIAARLRGLARRRLPLEGAQERSAAVLASLCDVAGEASVLFTKRSETVGTHKGQVSFPGGMRDPEDNSDEDTALRELQEELGFPRERVRVLGRFHDARAITGVRVTPVVGYLGEVDLGRLSPSAAEIDVVFTVPLAELLDPTKVGEQTFGARQGRPTTLPVFNAGPHPVWGLTAYLLDTLLREVIAPGAWS